MNIPMAYDVVPSVQAGYVQPSSGGGYIVPGRNVAAYSQLAPGPNAVMVGAPLTHPTSAPGSGLATPLLLSDVESQWQQEMVHEGLGHLPVAWYRQTPNQAVWSGYGIANRIISAMVNFGINVGLGYAVYKNNDEIGLWSEPSEWGSAPTSSLICWDIFITAFLIGFFTCLLSTKFIRKDMKDGKIVPVDAALLEQGVWRFVPVSLLGTCTRSLSIGLWAAAVCGSVILAVFEVVCVAGGMHLNDAGDHSSCSMNRTAYIYSKGAYAACIAIVVYPLILLMTLNTATLPPLDLTFFATNQKVRWEEEERKRLAALEQQ